MSKKNTGNDYLSRAYSYDLTGNATVVAGSITKAKLIAPRSGFMMVNFSVKTADDAADYIVFCQGASIAIDAANANAEVPALILETRVQCSVGKGRVSGSFIMPVVKDSYYGLVCSSSAVGAIVSGSAVITFI